MTPQIYSIKRHGTTIDQCDREPVQTPGCIQPCGALLAVRPGDFVILQASENAKAWLGLEIDELLQKPLRNVLGAEVAEALREFAARESLDRNPLFFQTIRLASAPSVALDVIVHSINGTLLLEFERAPVEAGPSVDYFGQVKRALTRFESATSLLDFCSILASEIRRITDLDRVMIYRFHADESGEVFAEAKRDDLQPWLGFRYPAHDIPKPAREIFKRIWIRPVPDIKAELAEMVPLANPDDGRPLEMTHCFLRGASVMYTEYLENMGVGAALTMTLKRDGELWGLIACHHYSPKEFSYPIRTACEFMAQSASLQLKGADEREHLRYRADIDAAHLKVVSRAASANDLRELTQGEPSLADGIQSTGFAIFHQNAWKLCGQTPSEPQLTELLEWLKTGAVFHHGVFATDQLAREWPKAEKIAPVASGILAVALSSHFRTVLIWFRPETIQTFAWAGNPNDLPLVSGPNGPRLTPRKSFELWRESVHNRSLPWNATELDAAERLRRLILDLVASHAEHLAHVNTDLARSNEELNAFAYVASHDLKEPLRGIHKHASQLLEDLQQEKLARDKSAERLEALLRLTTRMDDLINSLLHFSRVGNTALELEIYDMNEIVAESCEMVGALLHEKKLKVTVVQTLPSILCDRIRVREIFSNLISNAAKYNDKAVPVLEIGCLAQRPGQEVAPLDASANRSVGERVFYVGDNGIGIESRNFETIFRIFKRLHVRDAFGGGSGAGLSIVKKLVEQHGGEIWLTSKAGAGTTFYFTLEPKNEENSKW